MGWRAAVVVLGLLLAGCGSPSPDTAKDADVPPDGQAGLQGVVVSAAISPLAGANVSIPSLGASRLTDADGSFAFAGLVAGTYTLVVDLAGYLPQTLTAPTGGPLVQVVLEADTSSERYVEGRAYDGFVESSANVAGARTSNSDAPTFTFEGRLPDFIQIEMVWTSTQALGDRMDLTLIANDGGTVLPEAGHVEGASPLVATLDAAAIAEAGFGPGVDLDLAIFVGQDDAAGSTGAGVAVQQRFTLFTHMFYGYAPPPGWQFTADGESPPPT